LGPTPSHLAGPGIRWSGGNPSGLTPAPSTHPDLGPGRSPARNHYNDPAVDMARTVRP